MTERSRSIRELRQLRTNADDWITYASWTAVGTAVIMATLTLTAWLSPAERDPVVLASLMSGYVGQGAFGLKLRQRRVWTAWALMVAYGITFVAGVIENGFLSGLLLKGLIGYVYVRGFIATDAYDELSKQIAAADQERDPGTASLRAAAT